jgi:hypothetical protein
VTTHDAPDSFDAVPLVLGGARLPCDYRSAKVLRLMLENPQGCDATLTRARFVISFGWHPAHHRYYPELGPAVLSKLLELGHVSGPFTGKRFGVGPSELTMAAGQLHWTFGRRAIWIEYGYEGLLIRVREWSAVLTDALPAPIDIVPLFETFPAPVVCPHCANSAETYRRLREGPLVCQACGCSFPPPETLSTPAPGPSSPS